MLILTKNTSNDYARSRHIKYDEYAMSLPFFTLLLLISFASVNAVLFTPALPEIAEYFHINADIAEHTVTFFLMGYALGQLIYGPLANRFGRKPALYLGITLQIISCFICVLSSVVDAYWLLLVGRFLNFSLMAK